MNAEYVMVLAFQLAIVIALVIRMMNAEYAVVLAFQLAVATALAILARHVLGPSGTISGQLLSQVEEGRTTDGITAIVPSLVAVLHHGLHKLAPPTALASQQLKRSALRWTVVQLSPRMDMATTYALLGPITLGLGTVGRKAAVRLTPMLRCNGRKHAV